MFRRSVTRVPWAAVPYSSPQRHSSALAKPLYNPDQPYPIWFFDPDGPAYAAALSVARNSSLILESLHDVTGLPWWGTIAAGSLLIRVFFFPVNVYSLRNASRFFDAKPDIQALQRSHRSALVALVRVSLLSPCRCHRWLAHILRRGPQPHHTRSFK